MASAPLTGSRRVANFCATPQEPSRAALARRRVGAHRVGPRRLDAATAGRSRLEAAACVLASLAEAELAALLTPRQVQAVLISGVEVVSHLDEKPFAIYHARGAAALGRARRLPPLLRVRPPRPHAARAWGLPARRAREARAARASARAAAETELLAGRDEPRRSPRNGGRAELWLDVVLDRLSQGVYNEKAWDAFRQFLGVPW